MDTNTVIVIFVIVTVAFGLLSMRPENVDPIVAQPVAYTDRLPQLPPKHFWTVGWSFGPNGFLAVQIDRERSLGFIYMGVDTVSAVPVGGDLVQAARIALRYAGLPENARYTEPKTDDISPDRFGPASENLPPSVAEADTVEIPIVHPHIVRVERSA